MYKRQVLSTVFMFALETPTIEQFRGAAVSIAYCGIMSSGVAYTLQIVGQKELDPTIASLAMCLELSLIHISADR